MVQALYQVVQVLYLVYCPVHPGPLVRSLWTGRYHPSSDELCLGLKCPLNEPGASWFSLKCVEAQQVAWLLIARLQIAIKLIHIDLHLFI